MDNVILLILSHELRVVGYENLGITIGSLSTETTKIHEVTLKYTATQYLRETLYRSILKTNKIFLTLVHYK